MKVFKGFLFLSVMALSLLVINCSTEAPRNANAASGTVEKPDSTIVTSTASDGTKSEVRTFKSGDVASVTRVTRTGGQRTATVEFRDGRKVEIKDDSAIERAMDDTTEVVAKTANKTWEGTKEVGKEVGDKAEDVGDKAADTGKAIGKGAKRGAVKVGKEVGDKAEDVGDKTVEGAKKVGKGFKKVVGKDN